MYGQKMASNGNPISCRYGNATASDQFVVIILAGWPADLGIFVIRNRTMRFFFQNNFTLTTFAAER